MGSHFSWAVKGVRSEDADIFAARLETTLNQLEDADFEIYDVMEVPGTKAHGTVVVGRKPRRFPRTDFPVPADERPNNSSHTLDPRRLRAQR